MYKAAETAVSHESSTTNTPSEQLSSSSSSTQQDSSTFRDMQQAENEFVVVDSKISRKKKDHDHIKKKDTTNFMVAKDIIIHNKHDKNDDNLKHPEPISTNAGIQSE